MKSFIEKILRMDIVVVENKAIYKKMPPAFRGRYTVYDVKTNDIPWVAIAPKKNIGLVMLRKDRIHVEKILKQNCALFLEDATFYIKEKLLDEGIPFVLANKCIYLPFIGCFLTYDKEKQTEEIKKISYQTQRLFLIAIYEKWQKVNATNAAKRMGVSKMTVSRCFDELEMLDIDVLEVVGKTRMISIPKDRKQLWIDNVKKLRNPVIQKNILENDINLNNKAGISALSQLSLLSDNIYPTYALTKTEKNISIKNERKVGILDDIGCVVLKLGYFIDFHEKGLQDPLSISLSMSEEELTDDRINISIDEMLEEYVWSMD